jgi:hypothetical protein
MRRIDCVVALLFAAGVAAGPWALAGGKDAGSARKTAIAPRERLVIHEWGTFTSLQDEAGRTITGANSDDEPVPEFVHRISELIPRPTELAPVYKKGVPRTHSQVRMRLETPVLYFYPPAGQREPLHANVQVGFRGGWLTEYYPAADVSAPGLHEGNFRFAGLSPKTMGTLDWHDLTIGGNYSLPETDAQVWLAPRQVKAATVRAPGGEAEKYLFYRGVGNLPSPLNVSRSEDNDALVIREDVNPDLGLRAPLSIRAMWLVHVREDGSVAFRTLGSVELTGASGRELARTSIDFAAADKPAEKKSTPAGEAKPALESLIDQYAPANLAALRTEMRKELIADGLYIDEADAMLKTWELAYFKSPGLRLFYLLPQQWTDAVLPLRCSLLADVSRTMVGRVELVTPKQRTLLKKIGSGAVSKTNWFFESLQSKSARSEMLAQLADGKARFQDLNIPIPPDYQSYIDLGRFRDALILDEHTRHPFLGLGRFVEAYNLEYYTPAEDAAATAKTAQNQ